MLGEDFCANFGQRTALLMCWQLDACSYFLREKALWPNRAQIMQAKQIHGDNVTGY